jgi:ABC-2 type transport system permease protein
MSTPYLALARAGFRRWSSYRAATLAGIFTNTMFGFFGVAIMLAALDAAGGEINGYSDADAVTYMWLTQALIGTLAVWRWIEVAERIQTGDIVTDFQRPVDLQSTYLAQDLGRALYQFLARGIPPFVVGMIFFAVVLPDDGAQWLAFSLSVVLAVVVSFGVRFIVNLCAFWVLDWRGVQGLSSAIMTIASGFVVPLAFFPEWAERALLLLPWASMVQIPVDIFLGKRDGTTLVSGFALQLFWAATLLTIGRVLLARASRRVVVQGG